MIYGKYRPGLLLMIVILSGVSFLSVLASVKLVRATDFTVTPTFDLTTSSNITGATNAVYEFHGADNDTSVAISNLSVVIPAGYVVNPAYLTTTPGILVMNISGGIIGKPPSGKTGNATTTTTSGTFNVYGEGKLVGNSTLVAPTSTSNGSLTFVFPQRVANFTEGRYVDLITVPGLLINPTSPGVYNWTATATPGGFPPNDPVKMIARPGYSQSITIVTAVPEFSGAAVGLVVAIMTVVTTGLIALRAKKPKRSLRLN